MGLQSGSSIRASDLLFWYQAIFLHVSRIGQLTWMQMVDTLLKNINMSSLTPLFSPPLSVDQALDGLADSPVDLGWRGPRAFQCFSSNRYIVEGT